LLRLFSRWKFVACLSLDALRVTGHHHPLQVDPVGVAAFRLLCYKYLSVEVYPGVHRLERLFANGVAVDIENNSVPEYPEMELVPL